MDKLKLSLLMGAGLFLSACATTDAPKDLGKLEYTGFTVKSDGSAFQSVMGLSCPANLDGMQRGKTQVYRDDGTDIGCNYVDADRFFTVYFSRFPNDDLETNFRAAQYHLENRFKPEGYEFSEALSESCSAKSMDVASVMAGFAGILSGENTSNEITITKTPSAVYTNPTERKMTLVIVDEMFKDEYYKVRYTGPFNADKDVDQVCELARSNFLKTKDAVGEARGIEKSETEKMLGLIDQSSDDKT